MNGSVVGCLGVTRSTVISTALALGATLIAWPLTTGWPFRVTFAFWNAPKRIWLSGFGCWVLSGVDPTCTSSLPPPATGLAWTNGRGTQAVGFTPILTVVGADNCVPSLAR